LSTPKSVYPVKPKTLPKSLGFNRYALYFDGSEDYVDLPNGLGSLSDSYTIVFWSYHETPNDGDRDTDIGLYYGYEVAMEDLGDGTYRVLQRNAADTTNRTISDTVEANRWTHWAATFDGAEIRLFKNGVEVPTSPVACDGMATDLTDGNRIGSGWGVSRFLDGKMDDIQIYNRKLTGNEVEDVALNYHNPVDFGSLVGWWKLEEGVGTTATDSSGSGNHGTLEPVASPPTWEDVEKWELRAEVGL